MTEDIRLPEAAIAAMAQGNKVQAVAIVRREMGLGLAEAKDLVERHHGTDSASAGLEAQPDGLSSVREAIASGHKLEAVKRMRELTGLGLKEALDEVEAMAAGSGTMEGALPRAQPGAAQRTLHTDVVGRGDRGRWWWLLFAVAAVIGGLWWRLG